MKKIFYSLSIFAFVFLALSCVNTDYVEKDYSKNVQRLKDSTPYESNTVQLTKEYLVDSTQAKEIRDYFKANTDLDLDAIAASEKSTWEKAVEVAVFVAKNIPHNNQKKMLDNYNAITLWEYSRSVPSGFNCRWHGIILSELLLSIGMRSSLVTCLPYDDDDNDCHVVNIVWLPELNKWAMIDSDMTEYVTGDGGVPLSLQEMREYIQNDKSFKVNALPGFEKSRFAKPSGIKYMQAYWTKNLYWFALYKIYAFDLEYARNADGARTYINNYIYLAPPGYTSSNMKKDKQILYDDNAFWSY